MNSNKREEVTNCQCLLGWARPEKMQPMHLLPLITVIGVSIVCSVFLGFRMGGGQKPTGPFLAVYRRTALRGIPLTGLMATVGILSLGSSSVFSLGINLNLEIIRAKASFDSRRANRMPGIRYKNITYLYLLPCLNNGVQKNSFS